MNGTLTKLNGWVSLLKYVTPALLAIIAFFLQQLHEDIEDGKEAEKEMLRQVVRLTAVLDAMERRVAINEGNIIFNRDRASEATIRGDALEKNQERLWEELGRLRGP